MRKRNDGWRRVGSAVVLSVVVVAGAALAGVGGEASDGPRFLDAIIATDGPPAPPGPSAESHEEALGPGTHVFADPVGDAEVLGAAPVPLEGVDLVAGFMGLSEDGETLVVSLEVDEVPDPAERTAMVAAGAGWAFTFADRNGTEYTLRARPFPTDPSAAALVVELCSGGEAVATNERLAGVLDDGRDRVVWTLPLHQMGYDFRGTLTGPFATAMQYRVSEVPTGSPTTCSADPPDGQLDRAPDEGVGSDFPTAPPEPPANDAFDDAAPIATLPFKDSRDAAGATVEADEPAACGPIEATVWYGFAPDEETTVEIEVERARGVAVYRGSTLEDLELLACGETSVRPVVVGADEPHWVQVDADPVPGARPAVDVVGKALQDPPRTPDDALPGHEPVETGDGLARFVVEGTAGFALDAGLVASSRDAHNIPLRLHGDEWRIEAHLRWDSEAVDLNLGLQDDDGRNVAGSSHSQVLLATVLQHCDDVPAVGSCILYDGANGTTEEYLTAGPGQLGAGEWGLTLVEANNWTPASLEEDQPWTLEVWVYTRVAEPLHDPFG